jgi:hypothetical protein
MDVIMTEPPTIFFVAAIVAVIAIVVDAPNSAPKLLHKKAVNVKNGEDGITSNSLDPKCFCCSCSQPTPGAARSGRHSFRGVVLDLVLSSYMTEMQKNFGGSAPAASRILQDLEHESFKIVISKYE